MINLRPVLKILGLLLSVIGLLMLSGIGFSLYYRSPDAGALALSGCITIATGLSCWFFNRNDESDILKREGYLIVAFGWLGMSFFSTLPYLLSGVTTDLTDALFESVSGLTTTGASILSDIEAVPPGILFWRSLTQWIGGMGIIVLTVALFPLLGMGGIELFVAEAPGPTSDKIHPRIRETAKRLWLIYVGLTAILFVILKTAGLSIFDAINHAMTTMSTGGFSTKNASMMHYDTPAVQYPVILFMFLAGTNFTLLYFGFLGRWKSIWKSDEFKTYLFVVLTLIAIVTVKVYTTLGEGLEQAFRVAAFQVVSIITTTGYVSADYTSWGNSMVMLFFILLFMGASAGSTSGGIKMIRHLAIFKNSFLEFKRLLHPRAVIRTKIDQQVVAGRIMTHILVFLLIYLILFVIGSIVMSLMGLDFITAIGATATALGNVGPAIGEVGPVENFSALPAAAKWYLALYMLLGRLELFSILILFTPYFWKSN